MKSKRVFLDTMKFLPSILETSKTSPTFSNIFEKTRDAFNNGYSVSVTSIRISES